ncbi:elongation factor P [Altererythrobacter sp.]|uniref:elongation factor P n=1 Tax=Altererythrobacter sp. TaxID=1872480 RepID=UPI003D04C293
MTIILSALVTIATTAGLATTAPLAAKGGLLKTMPHGSYQCGLPGDASGPPWEPVPGASFRLANASSYRSEGGRGTYLLKGDEFIFTRGPLKGTQYRRTGPNELQIIQPDGSLGKQLCVRTGGSR